MRVITYVSGHFPEPFAYCVRQKTQFSLNQTFLKASGKTKS